MFYRFEKDITNFYMCEVEADSLEEAKKYAEDWDNWEDDLGGESDVPLYICKVAESSEKMDEGDCEILDSGEFWNNYNK